LKILLADDDTDDCFFFEKAVEELQLSTHLKIVHDGQQLMNYLSENSKDLPDVLFLDLNMPRKNGFECLCEIKEDTRLKVIPVVMFSTAFPQDQIYEANMINTLLKIGAHHFIRKPGDFEQLKQIIYLTLTMFTETKSMDV
jgi:CheY-like chemotaxis protein